MGDFCKESLLLRTINKLSNEMCFSRPSLTIQLNRRVFAYFFSEIMDVMRIPYMKAIGLSISQIIPIHPPLLTSCFKNYSLPFIV